MKNSIVRTKLLKRLKRPFQLLEVMVAIFLLLVCIAPAIHIFSNLYKQQQESAREYKQDLMANAVHAAIVEKLYQKELAFDTIFEDSWKPLESDELQKQLSDSGMQASYRFIETSKPKRIKKGSLFKYLTTLEVSITPLFQRSSNEASSYLYKVYIETKIPPAESEEIQDEDEKQSEELQRNEA